MSAQPGSRTSVRFPWVSGLIVLLGLVVMAPFALACLGVLRSASVGAVSAPSPTPSASARTLTGDNITVTPTSYFILGYGYWRAGESCIKALVGWPLDGTPESGFADLMAGCKAHELGLPQPQPGVSYTAPDYLF